MNRNVRKFRLPLYKKKAIALKLFDLNRVLDI